jgi:hypothetical protein
VCESPLRSESQRALADTIERNMKIILSLIIIFLLGCNNNSVKENSLSSIGSNKTPKVDSTITKTIDSNFQVDTNTYIATINPKYNIVEATINDSVMFVAKSGELFLYWSYSHNAVLKNGKFGYIPPEKVIKVDTIPFKFQFDAKSVHFDENYELYQTAKENNINLNKVFSDIIRKDQKAMFRLLTLNDKVDGASAEEYLSDFWKAINFWSDDELSNFILKLNKKEQITFSALLMSSSYLEPKLYYKIYYPKTLQIITNKN